MAPSHTDQEYEAELKTLRELILEMGRKVDAMIAASIRALIERDATLAHRTIETDAQVNRLEVEIDDLCLRILARRQPVASDLRFITTALKLVTDLERIGDMAVNICERAGELALDPPLRANDDLAEMAAIARGMIQGALAAFGERDPSASQDIIERDRSIDVYYTRIYRELLELMLADRHAIQRAIRTQSIAKYIERIGDHATNLAELVVFMVKGKDIRHARRIDAVP